MDDPRDALKKVGFKVLEDWALMLAEEVKRESCPFRKEETLYLSSMKFEGVMDGLIYIAAQKPFLDGLTRNLLGLEPNEEIKIEDSQDAFREMANVLLGNFLTEAYGEDTAFALTNPAVSTTSVTELDQALPGRTTYYFMADNEPVAFTFTVTG